MSHRYVYDDDGGDDDDNNDNSIQLTSMMRREERAIIVIGGPGAKGATTVRGNGTANRRRQNQQEKLFPEALRRLRKWYKLCYLFLYTALTLLCYAVPRSTAWDETGTAIMPETFATVLVATVIAVASFFAVQGSDPGYMDEGILDDSEGLNDEEDDEEIVSYKLEGDRNGRKGKESTNGTTTDLDLNRPGGHDDVLEHRELVLEMETRRCQYILDEVEHHMRDDEEKGGQCEREQAAGMIGRPANARGYVSVSQFLDALTPRNYEQEDSTFCRKCFIKVPLRSHHCRQCERCVATFDHHCSIIGTCVGERNHCRFWWFLLTNNIALIVGLSIVHSGFHRHTGDNGEETWMDANGTALVAAVTFWSVTIFAFPLLAMHTWLLLSSMTGYECIKGPEGLKYLEGTQDFDLPFSQGLVGNIRGFCCIRDGIWGILGSRWKPTQWDPPGRMEHNSENIFDNVWENKYWSCC